MLVNNDFLTCPGLKTLLTDMDFNMEISFDHRILCSLVDMASAAGPCLLNLKVCGLE